MVLTTSDKIYISESPLDVGGRGVFCKKNINKGDVIENCPIIEIPEDNLEFLENTIFINYIFFYGKKKEKALLALGFGSIYNHSYSPNAAYIINPKDHVLEISAINAIPKDTEITFNYKGESNSNYPLWFEETIKQLQY